MTGGLAGDTSAGVTAVGLEGVLTKFQIGRQQRTSTNRRVGGLRVLPQQDHHFTTGLLTVSRQDVISLLRPSLQTFSLCPRSRETIQQRPNPCPCRSCTSASQ